MAKIKTTVTKVIHASLPDGLRQYVVICAEWTNTKMLEEVGHRLRLARSSGYQGVDVFCFFVAFFCAIAQFRSLHAFSKKCSRWGQCLAAASGRLKWATQSSISRALDGLVPENLQSFCDWLLIDSLKTHLISTHESVITRDCCGKAWHVFHFDPRVTALHQRALPKDPEDEEYPWLSVRRSEGFAQKGYPGRQRGNVQISRTMLQHAGTSQWLMVRVAGGNGTFEDDLNDATKMIKKWASKHDVDESQCLICIDGFGRGYLQARVCSQSGIPYITRLSSYDLLNEEEVVEQMRRKSWELVEDSGSGPGRWACEVGEHCFKGGHLARLIITRFKTEKEKKSGAGHLLDGYQYEMFVTTLDPKSWPASEVVTEYYARCGLENRYAQCDRELGLGRIFHYSEAGQMLAEAVALWLWNFRLFRGGDLEGPLKDLDRKPQQRKVPSLAPSLVLPVVAQDTEKMDRACPMDSQTANQDDETGQDSKMKSLEMDLFIEERLKQYKGWQWDTELKKPRCPLSEPLRLHSVKAAVNDRTTLVFRSRRLACFDCEYRRQCTSSTAPDFRKDIWITLPLAIDHVEAILRLNHPSFETRQKVSDQVQAMNRRVRIVDDDDLPGPYHRIPPALVPSVLRAAFVETCSLTEPQIEVKKFPDKKPTPRYYALTAAKRQKRRKTWKQRLEANALPATTRVHLHIPAPDKLASLIRQWAA